MSRTPAAPDFQLLDIPLTSGLSQKTDSRLLPLGQSSNVTNVILSKSGSMQKSQGYSALGTTNPTTGESALAIPRIAPHNYELVAVATTTAAGISGAWTRSEAGDALFLNDRISEAYIPPTDTVLLQTSQPQELDTCVNATASTPYELHVGLWNNQVFYSVTQPTVEVGTAAVARAFVVPTSPVTQLNSLGHVYYAPKVILCGTTAILTAKDSVTNIWRVTMDMTQPWLGWSAAGQLAIDAKTSLGTYGHDTNGIYDTCAGDDFSGTFILAYESNNLGTNSITVAKFSVATLLLQQKTTIPDATWTASGNDISAIAVRASIAGGAVWVAYAYSASGSTTVAPITTVSAGAVDYPNLAVSFSASGVDLTNGANAYPAPRLIDIKNAGTAGVSAFTQQVMWSPCTLPPSASASATAAPVLVGASSYNLLTNEPCAGIYKAACYPSSGTTALHPNQPRWTPNVVMASRMAVVQNARGIQHAYVCGWVPSNNEIPGATSLQNFAIGAPGSGYNFNGVAYPPSVIFNNGGTGGSGAQASVVADPVTGTITGINVVSGGSGYLSKPTVDLLDGTTAAFGSGANLQFLLDGSTGLMTGVLVLSGGTNYNTSPQSVPVFATDPGGTGATVSAGTYLGYANVSPSGVITSVTTVVGGSTFAPGTGQPFVPSHSLGQTGSGATITFTLPSPQIQNIQGSFFLFCDDTFTDVTAQQSLASALGTPTSYNVPMRMCGLWKPRLAKNAMFATARTLPHLMLNPNGSASGDIWQTDLPIDVSAELSVGTVCSADFGCEYNYQPGELGGLTGFAGALPCLYDGSRTSDIAFPYFPENLVITPIPGLLVAGTYQYIAIYTRVDAQGNVSRSGRSVQGTAVLATGGPYNVEILVPCMSFSTAQRGQPTEDVAAGISAQPVEAIELYRTVNGGTTFYYSQAKPNRVDQAYVQFIDNIADANLANNRELYGDGLDGIVPGSILDNLCPPPFQGLIVHKERLWGYSGNEVWYSKAFTDGEGFGFNELFAFTVDDGPGNITGLATMDERLIVFKRDRIFYVTGDGPADNNTSNDLQPPQRIQSDVGCINWRSIVSTPAGVWFESDNQLYVMSRKLEVSPAGKFVEDLLNVYSDITSATLDMRNGVINWTCANPSPAVGAPAGIIIVFNWVLDCWTSSQYQPARGTAPQLESACLSGPALAYTVTDGGANLYRQTTGTGAGSYFWNGSYESFVWESPWIKPPSTQGWARVEMVNFFWQANDPCLMQLSFAYNYSNTYSETWTVSANAQANVVTPYVQWAEQPTNPQCESIRIRVMDVQDTAIPPVSGAGPTLIGVQVEYVDQGGAFRHSTTQRGSA